MRSETHGRLPRLQRVGVIADAPPLREAVDDGGAEMDAAVEPRDAGFVGGLGETLEGARIASVRRTGLVLERVVLAEERRQHRVHGAGHRAVAARIFGEGRRVEHRLPFRVDDLLDVGDRAQQVVLELGVPAADEGVRQGDPHARQQVDIVFQREVGAVGHLQGDRHPVAGRRHRQHGIVGPEARDGGLFGRHRSCRSRRLPGPPCRTARPGSTL